MNASWRDDVARLLRKGATSVETAVDERRRALERRLGLGRPRTIQAYHGWSNASRAWCCCRVLANKLAGGPKDHDNWWDNLLNTYRRWDSDEVPGVRLEATLDGHRVEATSDEEGYAGFHFDLARPLAERYWQEATLRVLEGGEEIVARCGILNPPRDARFGIISDVDDTIIHSSITNLLVAARLTFLNNARTRKPFEGVAELYRALHTQSADPEAPSRNPVFYVSSSAWNLYDLLSDFIDLNRIPVGPLLLRDLGLDEHKFIKSSHEHKLVKARRILAWYPHLPFLLFGDSGQMDAELYTRAAEEHPDRIRAIFIRDVDPGTASDRDAGVLAHAKRAEAVGVPMFLVRDSLEAGQRCVELGLLPPDVLPAVHEERDADHARPEETLTQTAADAAGLMADAATEGDGEGGDARA